ncbi:unnamed protein product [Coffea canephora]|uniref:BHLH domain-containing protein n=2 Tax=Coffea TaxID=13442 RepID=A0A068U2H5_COFCA|nr:transcription factor bHLH61-like isoform X1 [Coffea arabica]XP_027076136.1 transcription factor bHLH61-like isoform X2 [Coffea arabica]CDP02676.1 unnamed protein product [Coffea canephora]
MEHTDQTQNGLLEEFLVAPKLDSYWTTFPGGGIEIFPNGWNCESFDRNDHNQDLLTSNPNSNSLLGLLSSPAALLAAGSHESGFAFPFGESTSYPFLDHVGDGFSTAVPELGSSYDRSNFDSLPPVPIQQDYGEGMVEHGGNLGLRGLQEGKGFCKVEVEQPTATSIGASRVGLCGDKRSKIKKAEGQPSKNLMAERRRRKRLNDRLSMLRSIVPKISKMDRTSILGDTIDYMKELLDKIHKSREESTEENINQLTKIGNLKQLKPNEVVARNPPKFDVERRSVDTRIEICCTAKPGMLLSTVSTMEALGLDIQQCVISCFNDFSVQASCSEVAEHRRIVGSEDVKQALFRNAGYGGRCL